MAYATISISQSGDTLVAQIQTASGYTIEPIVWNWYNSDGVSQTGHVDEGKSQSRFTPSTPGTYYAQCQFNWQSTEGVTTHYYDASWSGQNKVNYKTGSLFVLYKTFSIDHTTGAISITDPMTSTMTALVNNGAVFFTNGNRVQGLGTDPDGTPYYTWMRISIDDYPTTTYPSGTTHIASDRIVYDPVVEAWTNWSSWGTGTDLSNLSAYSWNAFTAWVNRVRSKAGIGTYSFTTVSSGYAIAAATVNQARSAIAAIPGHGTLPDAVSAGDPIRGAWFRQLAEAANAAL